ncbi:MAG: hypothetical protein ABEJ68_07615 [Halobacteriaceae archaeon]
MALRYAERGRGRHDVVMEACPCGYNFDPCEFRHLHFLRDHDPEDFGLSSLGDRSDADGPLIEPNPVVATDGGEASE